MIKISAIHYTHDLHFLSTEALYTYMKVIIYIGSVIINQLNYTHYVLGTTCYRILYTYYVPSKFPVGFRIRSSHLLLSNYGFLLVSLSKENQGRFTLKIGFRQCRTKVLTQIVRLKSIPKVRNRIVYRRFITIPVVLINATNSVLKRHYNPG